MLTLIPYTQLNRGHGTSAVISHFDSGIEARATVDAYELE